MAHGGIVGCYFERFLAILAASDACLCQLLDVVHETVQVPLRVHLGLAAQVEPVQPLVVADVGKHRLHGAHALAVQAPAQGRFTSSAGLYLPWSLKRSSRWHIALPAISAGIDGSCRKAVLSSLW